MGNSAVVNPVKETYSYGKRSPVNLLRISRYSGATQIQQYLPWKYKPIVASLGVKIDKPAAAYKFFKF